MAPTEKKKKQKRKEKTLDGLIKEEGSSSSFRFGKTSLMYNLKWLIIYISIVIMNHQDHQSVIA